MQITEQELRAIEAPERTKTWNPVSHGAVLDQVNSVLHDFGITTISLRADVNKTGTNSFVTHQLDTGSDDVRKLELGWRNSIDKKFSLGFTAGNTVIVCSNLVFSGQWMEFRKHDGELELDYVKEMAARGVDKMMGRAKSFAAWHDKMQLVERDEHHAHHLMIEMVRSGIVAGNSINDLLNAYDEERERYGDTMYTVYNSATQMFRSLGLNSISTRSDQLNKLVKKDMIMNPA